MNLDVEILYHFEGRVQCSGNIYNKDKLSPSLCAAMGTGGANVPLIIIEDKQDGDK